MSRPSRTPPVPMGSVEQEWTLYDSRNRAAQADYRQRMDALAVANERAET